MSSGLLLKSLCRFIQSAVDDYAAAQGEDKLFKAPKVLDWYLPFKNPKLPEKIDFPYIVARIVNGQDGSEENRRDDRSLVSIDIAFGVYSEATEVDGITHPTGGYDLMNLMDHVRFALLQQGMLDDRYELQKPYKWEIPEEQPYPMWVGQAHTLWTVPQVYTKPDPFIFAH